MGRLGDSSLTGATGGSDSIIDGVFAWENGFDLGFISGASFRYDGWSGAGG